MANSQCLQKETTTMRFFSVRDVQKARVPRQRGNQPRRPRRYQPRLETVEERLLPGDTILGALLGTAWLMPNVPSVDFDSEMGRANGLSATSAAMPESNWSAPGVDDSSSLFGDL